MKRLLLILAFGFSAAVAAAQTAATPTAILNAAGRGDYVAAAKAAASLADGYRKNGEVAQALRYDSTAVHYARQGTDSLLLLKTLNNYALQLTDAGKLPKADALLSEAEGLLHLSKSEDYRWHQIRGGHAFKRFRMDEAIAVYKRGLAKAEGAADTEPVMNFKLSIGEAVLYKGKQDSMRLVYEALDYFEKNKLYASAYKAASVIGKSFLYAAFNADKAIGYYQKAQDFARRSGDETKMAVARLNLGEAYLAQRKYAESESEFRKAAADCERRSDWSRAAIAQMYLGKLYTETDELDKAGRSFDAAEKANGIVQSPFLTAGINNYKSLYLAKRKDYRGADSLMTAGGKIMLANVDKDLAKMAVKKMMEGDPVSAKEREAVMEIVESRGRTRPDAFRVDSIDLKKLQNLNIYTGRPAHADSAIVAVASENMLRLDAQFQNTTMADSLKLQRQETDFAKKEAALALQAKVLAQQESQTKNLLLAGAALAVALIAASLWLQIRNRRRAERDKARIEMLQNEIHHRVKNNLAVINRLVDVAGKNSVHDASLDALKTRIKSIELLHRHLYSEEARTGNIALQPYFDDLCAAVAATFATAKDIRISVNADAEVESAVAEKLGLIVNELVTNSLKYAFPDKDEGAIHVIANQDEKELKLTVEDDGIGMADEKARGSYGMKLIKGLSHELNGKFSFQNNGGTQFQLAIPV